MSQFNQHNNAKQKPASNTWLYYQGCFLVFALVLGGGTTKGLYTDYILQIAALPMVVHLIMQYRLGRVKKLVSIFLVGLLLAFAFQIFPQLPVNTEKFSFGTIDTGRTIDSFVFTLTLVAVFYGIYSLDETNRARIAPFLFLGFAINFVFAIAQFSVNDTGFSVPGLPYVVGGGFFANYNHLASLFYVTIPFVVLAFHNRRFSILSVPVVASILLFLFVVGSLSGVILGTVSFVISYVFLGNSRILKAGTLFVLIAGAIAISPFLINEITLEGRYSLSRAIFAQNTIEAIRDYLPFGSGYGTFILVYPNYALDTGLFASYVNHAHNDYLELLLEGGVPAALLILLYLAVLASVLIKGNLSGLQKVAFIGIAFLLIHSGVSYPLRTMAMGTVFAFFNGLALADHKPLRRRSG